MRWFCVIPVLSVVLLLPGCGTGSKKSDKPETVGPLGGGTGGGTPARVYGPNSFGGTPVKQGGNISPEAQKKALEGYNPDDNVWTNPDDPDAEIPELDGLFSAPKQKGPWGDSETEALRESKRTGKPLLIWFTDSQNSTASNLLRDKLFSTPDFEKWASENTVRLVVDQNVTSKTLADLDAKKIHVRNLKKKYKASGYPSLHLLAPSGEVIGIYKSYRPGQEDFIWGQLKQGVSVAKESQKSWRASLEKKGYRDWSNDSGKVIFAKLAAYHEGQMILVEPDGQRVRTHEKSLSAGDRVWIQDEKRKRGIN
ncbi:hypothetical protein [Luteolibacter soli]|uniref:Thioredoxin-like fold domain-containing protein n=1 Tax=Luteolibacter soli TaxID=3135280 RepID=A0ABU9AZV4_9BACT